MAHQIPEWETPRAPAPTKPHFFTRNSPLPLWTTNSASKEQLPTIAQPVSSRLGFRDRFDRVVPPHRTYFGRSRRVFLIVLGLIALCLLALILGLGIGLSKKDDSSSVALPLPDNTSTFTGDITYFATGLGSCGITSADTDHICAVSHIVFDAASTGSNPNTNPLCGLKIRVVRFDERVSANRSVDVTVVDRCVGCAATDLDLSYAAFDVVAARDLGRVRGSWAWLGAE